MSQQPEQPENIFAIDHNDSWGPLKRLLLENVREHYWGYGAALFFMSLVAFTTAGAAWIIKDVVNEIFVAQNQSLIWSIGGFVIVIYLIKGVASYAHMVILARVGNNIVARCQRRLFTHVLGQGVDFFQRVNSGLLVTQLSHNAQAARNVLNLIMTSLGRDLMTVVSLLAVMVYQDPYLSFFALAVVPLVVLGIAQLVKAVRGVAQQEFLSIAEIVSAMQQTAQGFRIVKAFSMEPVMESRMAKAVSGVEKRSNKIAALNAAANPLFETLGGFAVAGVIIYGGITITQHGRDPGSLVSFITALLLAAEPARRLGRLRVEVEAGLVGVRLMFAVLDTKSTMVDRPDAKALQPGPGAVRVENVSFAYSKQTPILRGVTIEAEPNSLTALVGPSGGGKTTLLTLIQRFYDPDQGRILIDGQDVAQVTQASLRETIAIVSQDVFLFTGSVAENIAFGRTGTTREEIVEAAKAANADDFIRALPHGYDTEVTELGANLSTGQRQRISIARAVLKDAPILLADEPTSALDAESEHKVQHALARLMKGRTTIVVAHRLSTVTSADRIYVIDQGAVVEDGRHSDLLLREGVYAQFYRLQAGNEAA